MQCDAEMSRNLTDLIYSIRPRWWSDSDEVFIIGTSKLSLASTIVAKEQDVSFAPASLAGTSLSHGVCYRFQVGLRHTNEVTLEEN